MLSCYLKTSVKEFQFRMFISTNIICGFDQIKAKTLVKLCDSHLTSYSGPAFFICLVFSAAGGLALLLCFPGSFLFLPVPFPLFGCCWGSRSWRSSRSRARPSWRFPFLPALFPPVICASPRARYGAGRNKNSSVVLQQQPAGVQTNSPDPSSGIYWSSPLWTRNTITTAKYTY